jgi:hypothetical protein
LAILQEDPVGGSGGGRRDETIAVIPLSDQIDNDVASAAVDDHEFHLVSLSLGGRDNDVGGDSRGGSKGGNFLNNIISNYALYLIFVFV